MNPTLYDVLGVSRAASPDEIRRAWRHAADRFEPGTGGSTKQFRLFNEAAEVLLDPERRKAYDATLGAEVPEPPTTAPVDDPAAVVPGPPMPGTARVATPEATGEATREATREEAGEETREEAGATRGRGVPTWLLAVLGVLTAVAVGVAAYAITQARSAEAYQEALDRAPAAAESAAAAVLSYDHRSLEADRDAAAKFLTDGYRRDYVDTFDKLVTENATETKATVEAEVLASSAMLGGGDREPDRVPVLLFVNQSTTSTAGSGQPSVALNRVRFDMVEVDGTWLVDGITSY